MIPGGHPQGRPPEQQGDHRPKIKAGTPAPAKIECQALCHKFYSTTTEAGDCSRQRPAPVGEMHLIIDNLTMEYFLRDLLVGIIGHGTREEWYARDAEEKAGVQHQLTRISDSDSKRRESRILRFLPNCPHYSVSGRVSWGSC